MADSVVKMVRGASFLVFDTSLSALVGLVAFAFISRLINKTEMGVMAVLLMVSSTCQLLSTLGLPSASTRFISESMGKGDAKTASAIASQTLSLNFLAASVLALLCFGLSGILSSFLLGAAHYEFLFQALAFNIVFVSLLPGLTGVLLGMKRLRELAVFGIASFSLQQALVIVLLASHMGLLGIVVGWGVANMFNCAVFLWSIVRSLNLSMMGRFSLRMLLSYSWPLYPVAFVSLLDNWFDRLLLLGYSLNELGVYNVAFKAFGYLYAIPIAISDAFFPHFSELKSTEGIEKLSVTFTSTSRYLAIFATPLALGLAAMAEPVISLFAGRGYVSAGQPLTVLCVAAAVSVFGLMLGKILLALDRTRAYSLIVLSTVVAGLALGKLLVPMLGPVGASVARAASMLLVLVFMLIAASRKIRIRIDREALWKSWVAGIVMVAVLITAQHVWKSSLLIPVYVAVGGLVYLLMLRATHTVAERDLEFLKRFLGLRIGTPISSLLRAVLIP